MTPNKLEPEVVKLLVEGLKEEYNAFYFYRSATNYCRNVGFEKAAEFFAKESEDELVHAKKIEDYVTDWNVTIPLPSIPKPVLEFSGLPEIIDMAYEMEYKLYELYEDISKSILDMGESCVFDFLAFFRGQQTSAVIEYSDKINMLEGTGKTKFELLLLEKKLF